MGEFTPENDRKTTAPCKFRARSKEARTIASPRALQLERSKARVVDVFSGLNGTATGRGEDTPPKKDGVTSPHVVGEVCGGLTRRGRKNPLTRGTGTAIIVQMAVKVCK